MIAGECPFGFECANTDSCTITGLGLEDVEVERAKNEGFQVETGTVASFVMICSNIDRLPEDRRRILTEISPQTAPGLVEEVLHRSATVDRAFGYMQERDAINAAIEGN